MRNSVLTQIAQAEKAKLGRSHPGHNQLKKVEKAIKTGKLSSGVKFEVPKMRHEGDKIMFSLDLCAKHFPYLLIPHTYLTMMVNGLGAVPRTDSKRVLELARRVVGKRKRMREKYGRDIISPRGEKAARATVDDEDAFINVGIAATQRAAQAIQRKQQVDQIFDIENIPGDKHPELIEWYKKNTVALGRVQKQLLALPENAGSLSNGG